ncbi:MAG: methyl-accepting chemotaxis protein [Tepidiphilus sp.]|nr:methyl-accepting chemotaxis protein [Tepidiphilus sp.]
MSKKMTIAKRLGWGFGSLLALMVLITAIGIQRVAFMDETLTAVNRGATLKQRYDDPLHSRYPGRGAR